MTEKKEHKINHRGSYTITGRIILKSDCERHAIKSAVENYLYNHYQFVTNIEMDILLDEDSFSGKLWTIFYTISAMFSTSGIIHIRKE